MVYKIALIAALMLVADAKRLRIPAYDYQNILLSSGDWEDDEPTKDFDEGTVDEVHDYTPETQLLQLDREQYNGLDDYAGMKFEAGTADEINQNFTNDELEDFDDTLF